MAMQQHPLPQDISSYRFRLIGDMTLKQFASLAICIVLAIISYSLPLPFFFKYPIVFFFLLLGVGMAFIPVQGRSLDVWIIAFIKSIYSPTQYIWKHDQTAQATEISQPSSEISSTTPQVTNPQIELAKGPVPVIQTPLQVEKAPVPVTPAVINPAVTSPITQVPPSTSPEPQEPISIPSPLITQPKPDEPIQKPVSPPPSANLPIPFTPTTINTLVGLTLTTDEHLLDSVLVEIKKDNLTIRATKSNKLGQFMFARPLDNGLYQILAEKDGFSFAPYSLELTGNIVKPLKIQAQ